MHRCLARHPEVSGFHDTGVPEDEGQHLQSVYPTAKAFGGAGRFGLNPKSRLTEDSDLVTDENRQRLISEWAPHWDMSAPYLVEKSPPNLVRMRFLQAMFPGSRFLVLIRHPAVIACASQRSAKRPLTSIVHHWVVCYETMAADSPRIDRLVISRYEDVVETPETSLAQIQDDLGLPVADIAEPIRTGINDRYMQEWRSQTWKNPLHLDTMLAGRVFESRVRPFGYSFSDA